jgi:hypothetical protein
VTNDPDVGLVHEPENYKLILEAVRSSGSKLKIGKTKYKPDQKKEESLEEQKDLATKEFTHVYFSEDEEDRFLAEVTAVDSILEHKPEEIKKRILDIVVSCGLYPDDPLFLVLCAMSAIELLIEDSPKAFEEQFSNWSAEIDDKLKEARVVVNKTLVQQQKTEITKAVQELIKVQRQEGWKNIFGSVLPAAGILLATLAIGIGIGIGTSRVTAGVLDPTGKRQLTLKQAQSLDWATSKEGQLAKNIVE